MKSLLMAVLVCTAFSAWAQIFDRGNFTGNLETNFQYLNKDTLIGADQPPSKALLNSYMNVYYTNGNFRAGARFESYLPRIQGYPTAFDGTGIGMRYAGWGNKFIDAQVGNFYEQFGNGLALRSYEDRALGYDNMMDGIRIRLTPWKGVTIKAVYGQQRLAFRGRIENALGIVRGVDGDFSLNEIFPKMADKKLQVTLGGSLVSKYQKDNMDELVLPQNVATYGGRFGLRYEGFYLNGEYVTKSQDPSADNNYIYNSGYAGIVNLGYSRKGLGILLSSKAVDNMSFRSDRSKVMQDVLINYLPALTKTHTYNLVSSLYPYATQPLGEIAYQAEIVYTIPRGSKLGGKYGTTLSLNASTAFRPKRTTINYNQPDVTGVPYRTSPWAMSDSMYWLDINASISRKFTPRFSAILSYYHINLNNNVAAVTKQEGYIRSNTVVLEALYKFKNKSSLRMEGQIMFVNRIDENNKIVRPGTPGSKPTDNGDWATLLLEYTINSNWVVSVMDQWNFGNPVVSKRAHHPYVTVGYVRGSTRVMASYGRQRAGMFCVGGVCRMVPASNGLTLTITQSF